MQSFSPPPAEVNDPPSPLICLPQTVGTTQDLIRQIRNAVRLLELSPPHEGCMLLTTIINLLLCDLWCRTCHPIPSCVGTEFSSFRGNGNRSLDFDFPTEVFGPLSEPPAGPPYSNALVGIGVFHVEGIDEGPGGRNNHHTTLAKADIVVASLQPDVEMWETQTQNSNGDFIDQAKWLAHLGSKLLLLGHGSVFDRNILTLLVQRAREESRRAILTPTSAHDGGVYLAIATLIAVRQVLLTSVATNRASVGENGEFLPAAVVARTPPPTRHPPLSSISIDRDNPARLIILHPTTMPIKRCILLLLNYLSHDIQTRARSCIDGIIQWFPHLPSAGTQRFSGTNSSGITQW